MHAERGDKMYHADIPVSVDLGESSAKASYTNGILELKIKLKECSSCGTILATIMAIAIVRGRIFVLT